MSAILVYCPHCKNDVAERTYRRHKVLYYNTATDVWENEECEEEPSPKKSRSGNYDISETEESNNLSIQPEDPLDSEVKDNGVDDIQLDPVANFDKGNTEEVWDDVTEEDVQLDLQGRSENEEVDNDNINSQEFQQMSIIARWTVLFISSWSVCFNISSAAISHLLRFLHGLITACGMFVPNLKYLARLIPKSIYSLRNAQGCLDDDFIKFAVCPKCESIYELSKCLGMDKCTYVKYPKHPQRKFREKCGTDLFKEVTLQNGKKHRYPIRSFCYRPIKDSIRLFLDRSGFEEMCESWRSRTVIQGTLRDVYDGRVWKSFINYDNKPFLGLPRRFGLLLNIDWFQPYKHSPHSSGGIYFSLLNLPRNERYKKENMIVAGVIPGPHEPSLSINTYLRPIVDELLELWENGFKYKGVDDEKEEDYYVALLCCSCDVPATRKVCGFLGHTAKVGCSKCKKNFKSGKFGEKMDYGGFQNIYEHRTDQEHRQIASKIQELSTKSAREAMEHQHGVRYTELMRLEYFNCITFTVIDPMHNLFQGTAKYMFKTIWSDKLSADSLSKIQVLVDNMTVPTTLGRVPRKIESSFSSFTSDQWKNWTLYFSVIALKKFLPKRDYDCWLIFVEACRLLCTPTVTVQNLRKGHEKIMEFCRTFESLYGSTAVTPNMHLHTHLVDCVLDYGPFHGFWLFGFERMNGILGSFNTNKRSPEIQFMRKIVQVQKITGLEKPDYFCQLFEPSFEFETQSEIELLNADAVQNILSLSSGAVSIDEGWLNGTHINFLGARHDAYMADHYLDFLKSSVAKILDIDLGTISGSCHKYFAMEMCGEKYGSSSSRLSRSSVVLGSWCGAEGEINEQGGNIRPGIIRFFITFFVQVNGTPRKVHFVFVHWFQKVSYTMCPIVTLWSRSMFEPEGPSCFLPVQRIAGKAICGQVTIQNEIVLAVIPHLRHIFY